MDQELLSAINSTKVLKEPKQALETFSITRILYCFVSQKTADVVNVKKGYIFSEKPQFITPNELMNEGFLLDSFEDDSSKEYAQWLTKNKQAVHFVKYGLQIRKQKISEEDIHTNYIQEVIDKLDDELKDNLMSSIILGKFNYSELSLLKFMVQFIEFSIESNIHEYQNRMIVEKNFRTNDLELNREIENRFYDAQLNKDKIVSLANWLQELNLYERYEDRIFSLFNDLEK